MTDCLVCCCPPVCECKIDCNDVKVSACVSRTEVNTNGKEEARSRTNGKVPSLPSQCDGDQSGILYCWRICIENCSTQTLCHARLTLDLRWKILAAGIGANTNPAGKIFQNCLLGGNTSGALATTEVDTNLPANLVTPVVADAWLGFGTFTNLFEDGNNQIPPGKWIVEVCAEIEKAQLVAAGILDCPSPALFPAVLTLRAETPFNNGCGVNTSAFVGCVPEAISVEPLSCINGNNPDLPCTRESLLP